ncbi:hypothetical protein CJ030_MR2G028745 [Morella rubra]|uniref:Uncharacterized protein n=1 Tax=Morella rubra TaxID=262757 RepID=A0A6A1WEW5_9ROSI|nr:hypothetical protein CJ030_MR2G028745 [Morella rubra]
MMRETRINITQGLLHVNMLVKNAVEKSTLDIKLMKGPLIANGKREYNTDGGGLDNRTKGVCVIKSRKLNVAFCNETGLKTINGPVKEILGAKHPFGAHNIDVRWPGNKIPGVIGAKGMNLFIHGGKPSGIFGRGFETFGLKMCKQWRNWRNQCLNLRGASGLYPYRRQDAPWR